MCKTESYPAENMNCGSSAGCAISPARDTPETARALNDLRAVVDRYDHLVGRLHDRLSCVVAPSSPVCADEKEGIGYQTGLASDINGLRCKLRDVTNSLESLYERIEL